MNVVAFRTSPTNGGLSCFGVSTDRVSVDQSLLMRLNDTVQHNSRVPDDMNDGV